MYGHDAEIPRPSLYKVLSYFVIRYMGSVGIMSHIEKIALHYQSKRIEHHPAWEFLRNKVIHF